MSYEEASGWMCERVDGEFMCMTFEDYKAMGGFVHAVMKPYKEVFDKSYEGPKNERL